MAVDIIYRQKTELERLLAKKYVLREGIAKAKKSLENSLIKVVIGPRRAGKSVFCLEMLREQNFGYLNFDSEETLKVGGHENIISLLEEAYPAARLCFLDEIQNVPRWELLVNTLQRRGFTVILTGSNANLLSGELASHLTGRYEEIKVYPFSFGEYLEAKDGNESLLVSYLQTGGYPEMVMNNLEPQNYLPTLREAIILKDIVKRYKIKFGAEFDGLIKLLSAGFTKQISLSNLGKTLEIGSHHTLNKYLNYLQGTYLFLVLERYHLKVKERIKLAKKIYYADTGFAAVNFSVTPDFGKLAENAVFLKLLRQGFIPGRDLFYYQTKTGKEVDFITLSGLKVSQLIQVCWEIEEEKTKKREMTALAETELDFGCKNRIIVTKENLADFLLNKCS